MTEASDGPQVSILVVTYKQHERLGRCLESVADAVCDLSTETIVVVNGVPLEREHHAARARGALVLHPPVNLGMPGGLHWARSHARGRALAVVQDDAEVDRPWLEPLLEVLDRDPSVGAVGSRVCLLDGTPWADGMVVAQGGWGRLLEPTERSEATWAVDACFFASCVVRAEAWDSAGGPNHRLFPNQHVDLEFGLRLAETDWSVVVARDSIVRHVRNASTTTRQRRYLMVRNHKILARDHHQILSRYPEPFRARADVDARLDQLALVARQRGCSPHPSRAAPPPIPLSVLVRDARADARRVRVGWTVFPARLWLSRLRRELRRWLSR
jgi:GT2 family glycosyltransferase